jgi:hypothetical protein
LLDSEGFDVWWDTEIYVGRSFADLIEQAIDDCRHVIVLWSPFSLKSEWVMREVGAFLLHCICRLMAQSGGSQGGEFTSAFGGVAEGEWTDGLGCFRR